MKAWSLFTAVLLLGAASVSQAHDHQATPAAKTESKSVTLKGEIVDMGCYLGHDAKGMDHKSCALKCVAGGMPMGLLTAEGKLYLLTMSHENADPYNKAKELAAVKVEVTGMTMERSGMNAVEVTGIAEAKTATK